MNYVVNMKFDGCKYFHNIPVSFDDKSSEWNKKKSYFEYEIDIQLVLHIFTILYSLFDTYAYIETWQCSIKITRILVNLVVQISTVSTDILRKRRTKKRGVGWKLERRRCRMYTCADATSGAVQRVSILSKNTAWQPLRSIINEIR